MKTITLAKAHKILTECSAVIVDMGDGATVTYPSVADLAEGDNDNEFLYLENNNYYLKFREGDNLVVKVEGAVMFLTDAEGEEFAITVLQPMNLG